MAASIQTSVPLSFSLSNPRRRLPYSLSSFLPLSEARNLSSVKSPLLSISIPNGGAERLVEARVVSGQIKGPIPEMYLGDDYVVTEFGPMPIGPPLASIINGANGLDMDWIMKKVTAKQVHQLVKGTRKLPLIIGFYATWCGPCVHMAQELEMLAVEYEDRAIIVKVDTDEEYEFARDMQVRGLPTLYFISANPKKNAIRTEGLIPSVVIHDIIDNEM